MYIYIIFVHTDVYKSSYTRDLWMECCILRSFFVKWPAPELRHWKKRHKKYKKKYIPKHDFLRGELKKRRKEKSWKRQGKKRKERKKHGKSEKWATPQRPPSISDRRFVADLSGENVSDHRHLLPRLFAPPDPRSSCCPCSPSPDPWVASSLEVKSLGGG